MLPLSLPLSKVHVPTSSGNVSTDWTVPVCRNTPTTGKGGFHAAAAACDHNPTHTSGQGFSIYSINWPLMPVMPQFCE